MQERVRLADERAEADRGDAITAAERAAFAEQEVTSVRGQLAIAQEQVRAAQAQAVEAGTRAEQAEEHLRVVAQERRAEAEAAKALAEEQPQLEEVLRITKERLHRSGERLQETEARARAAEHDLESARQRTEELEGTMRREKLHDALQHLRGDDQPVHAPPIEERRAAAPFMKALSLDARNSVAAIQGLVLAMKHAEKADEQPAMLRKLNAHARKLDRLVGDLLDADRLARGDVELKVRRTDIEALAKRVLEECAFDGDRNIEIRSEKVVVAVDPIRVEGIIVALLNNAVDRSRPRHEITVRVAAKDDGALISVEDEEPSSDASLSPVVARFADVHGGWATVESRQGGGSAFRVFLPGEGARTAHTTIAPERDTIEIRDSAAAELSAEAPGA
jgi:K+-sensing histidine kinase KdpD